MTTKQYTCLVDGTELQALSMARTFGIKPISICVFGSTSCMLFVEATLDSLNEWFARTPINQGGCLLYYMEGDSLKGFGDERADEVANYNADK